MTHVRGVLGEVSCGVPPRFYVMISIGMDAGANGAVIALSSDGEYELLKLKEGPKALNKFMLEHGVDTDVMTLEQIVPRSGWGVKSMCSLYGSYMQCQQAAALVDCELNIVNPRTWQKMFGLVMKRPEGMSDGKWSTRKKVIHRDHASELIKGRVSTRVTHTNSDALLLAIYGLVQMGDDSWI